MQILKIMTSANLEVSQCLSTLHLVLVFFHIGVFSIISLISLLMTSNMLQEKEGIERNRIVYAYFQLALST